MPLPESRPFQIWEFDRAGPEKQLSRGSLLLVVKSYLALSELHKSCECQTLQIESMESEKASGKVATAKRQPPPEAEAQILTRRLVIAAFWAVALFLGLPIWWRTTSVYRAYLPLEAMLEW